MGPERLDALADVPTRLDETVGVQGQGGALLEFDPGRAEREAADAEGNPEDVVDDVDRAVGLPDQRWGWPAFAMRASPVVGS